MKNFNAVSHNRARPYFRIQHGRGEVYCSSGLLECSFSKRKCGRYGMICWVLAMEMLQGVWKQYLRPRAVVRYGVKIVLPSPPNYVTRSPGSLYKMANFATFQKRVIFRMLTLYLGFFLRRITVTWLKSRFFLHLKRQPEIDPCHFWLFCHNLAIFATFQNRVIISNIDCVFSRFSE